MKIEQDKEQFTPLLLQISALLTKAREAQDPAQLLYEKNFRAPLFQLEALSRIYSSTGPKKKRFTKLKIKFKRLEDLLGQIDYFDAFAKQFSGNARIPETVLAYFQSNKEKSMQELNKVLKDKGWLDGSQVSKIGTRITKVDWKPKAEHHARLLDLYQTETGRIKNFADGEQVSFNDIEAGIHEFRRKLRWLSIYAQALRGCIKLVAVEKERTFLKNYVTDEVAGSPYNKLPPPENERFYPLALSKYDFYALSWMIEKLGILKDQGLAILALSKAIKETDKIKDDREVIIRADQYLGDQAIALDNVLADANKIKDQFFKDRVLENLVI
ncbi:hypothetical protein DIU31_006095 [Mucilaginibacter rubeus]|uniref:Uncharacterized protein n=1 Tax=Mucilaginibacter rubeus TaxID=2027860 RepID=A0AAE6MHF0_9SPHI|nr:MULTISPECIES: hypothetical protein [Mucilaginibacter]QEM03112.1 hypothetical protein DIU31_006095 [Mucilaginibacter rubeus]QEM15730.1 hypothetical protein DIU38_006165 [Mucilaginibacter gossypii]QTE41529.1 hypothetical protein J3L19_21610 [Mucilaginibacter rubeus]QTE48135.1 hypothetical protein J3L21_21610 [Mucilaginibacter rubeus]QTE59526.1 hypothetical protein J3L23_13255 [Mucilaginibacter rubeus]